MTRPRRDRIRSLDELTLLDLEGIDIALRGGSVVDWHRLSFTGRDEAAAFLRAQEMDVEDAADRARLEALKNAAIDYLRRHFDFPVPRPVANDDVVSLLVRASGKGHRQLCACTILKVMHIMHHLEARELLFMLPTSHEQMFRLVEKKVYAVIGDALAQGMPIVEFIGGRKTKDSLYAKLLSKPEADATHVYDRLRFRIVTVERDDIFPVLSYLLRNLAPCNAVVPGQSTNTIFGLRTYCERHEALRELLPLMQRQPDPQLEAEPTELDNRFSASSYRVLHFVIDVPVRIPDALLEAAPPAAWPLGRVLLVQAEIQIIDQTTDRLNEEGDASHEAYKRRQKLAIMRRLKVGNAD
ncbi:MAG: TIGR04552 family protein [Myxococcales bacterium]|nr:TIGR04552 family protein [Myxococcales bacterium]